MNIFSTRKSEKVRNAFFSGFLILSLVLSQAALPITMVYAQTEGETPVEQIVETPTPVLEEEPVAEEVQTTVVIDVPQTITIEAKKIVCDSEADLPNWGAGGQTIDANTASTFLATKEGKCHLQSGWGFEWGDNAPDGGAATIGHVDGYTAFPNLTDENGLTIATVPVTEGSEIHVREVLQSGYIPFTGQNTDQNVSAEFYCSGDTLNYDNWDFIRAPQVGQSYNCVAFNAKIPEQLSCEQSVNLIENGDFEAPALSGGSWDIIPDSNTLLKWLVAWISPSVGRLGLEIQNNVAGISFGGTQHAELDGDAPVTIWQDVATIPGEQYSLSFKYSPRPGVLDNALQPKIDGTVLGAVVNADGSTNTDTVWQTITRVFTANSALTKVEIADVSSADSLGGYIDNVSLNCNPEPILQCDANASSDFMSDSFTQVDGHDAVAVATYNPANWTANIPGATWIWSEANVVDATVTTIKTFTKDFVITGTPLDSSILVAADDGYKVSMNGVPLTGAGCFDTVLTTDINEFVTAKNCVIPSSTMHTGMNTLSIEVTNFAQAGVDHTINPAGLLYKLTINNDECVVPPPTMGTIEITKYTCPANFIPNRTSNGVGSEVPQGCTLTPGVAFGYVYGSQTDANGPYPELSMTPTPGGITGQDGKLVIGPVLSSGRYLVKETDATNLAGLYCQGDGDTDPNNNDNQELTFVPANGVARCVAYNKAPVIEQLPVCSDNLDNDEDGLIDSADPVCHTDGNVNNPDSYNPAGTTEVNNLAICSDGKDNDSDGLIDSLDPGCLSGEGNTWNPNDTDESNGGGTGPSNPPSGGGSGGGMIIPPAAKGQVLGASAQCGIYLDDFLKIGKKNNKDEVKKLQGFLNDYLKLSPKLPVNGVFGLQTHKAVAKFQEQEAEYVLKPWVGVTLKNQAKGTGWVYKTTVTRINNIMCPELNLAIPAAIID